VGRVRGLAIFTRVRLTFVPTGLLWYAPFTRFFRAEGGLAACRHSMTERPRAFLRAYSSFAPAPGVRDTPVAPFPTSPACPMETGFKLRACRELANNRKVSRLLPFMAAMAEV